MDQREIHQRRYLNVEQAARYLGIAPGTIYNGICRSAKTPFPIKPRRIGGRVLFDRLALDKFMTEVK
jgi:predicted DNA-binding transcriptional regulator AlpA